MDAAAPIQSHGQLVHVSPAAEYHFHLVFSNKTESDAYCISIWQSLTERRVMVWQQKKPGATSHVSRLLALRLAAVSRVGLNRSTSAGDAPGRGSWLAARLESRSCAALIGSAGVGLIAHRGS